MTLAIAGRGWVTPLGSDIEDVSRRLLAGEQATVESISSQENDRTYPVFRVPVETLNIPPHPRLRRSSAISKFAAAAGLAALRDAGIDMNPEIAARTALIFAVSNGGVVYTKRFYHDVAETGARAASPLLFPETVFNAPASHLAAILAIAGASYTVVADGAVGALAVHMAHDLMENEALNYCLVVGAEEADWLVCDAYRKWRLSRDAPPIEPFQMPPRGTILSEGAGALLLARAGDVIIDRASAGANFSRRSDARAAVDRVFAELCASDKPSAVVASANGTFIDAAERRAIEKHCAGASVQTPKVSLGESIGAAGIWQIIYAAETLRSGKARSVIVSTCGMNQQVAGLRLAIA
jgi:3-oxoacyl-(acyl-carrier-protein) synthase